MKESKRYWKHFGDRGRVTFEWNAPRWGLALELQIGGMEGELFLLHIQLIAVACWLGLEHWRWARKLHFPYPETRNTGFYLAPAHDGLFGHLDIWQKMDEWRRGDWSWSWDFDRIVWGRREYKAVELSTVERDIPMPEKSYPATLTLLDETWSQPRKFWRRKVTRRSIKIDIPEGIPHPGKGTMDYNCGDDALMGLGFSGDDFAAAVKYTQQQAQWYRDNYPL